MKKESINHPFKVQRSRFAIKQLILNFRGFLIVVMLLGLFLLVLGCREKEKASAIPPVSAQKAMDQVPGRPGERKEAEGPGQAQTFTFHTILTKDLKRPLSANSFSKNDRIYLLTTWTGLQGSHEIKVLWIRPDNTVQETVRLNENIPSKLPTYTSWAYLSFTKGLLNISSLEGKFIGAWKARLFLDGKLLKEFGFTVF